MTFSVRLTLALSFLLIFILDANGVTASEADVAFGLNITSDLPSGNVPFVPIIDFTKLIADAGLSGVLDPNSIRVVDKTAGSIVAFARNEDFAYGDCGRLEWVIKNPSHKKYQIRFRTVEQRPALTPQDYVPMVGVGDLLRYNACKPRPIAMMYPARLVDVTGDGRVDLLVDINDSQDM